MWNVQVAKNAQYRRRLNQLSLWAERGMGGEYMSEYITMPPLTLIANRNRFRGPVPA
jgi:hypothetical protein